MKRYLYSTMLFFTVAVSACAAQNVTAEEKTTPVVSGKNAAVVAPVSPVALDEITSADFKRAIQTAVRNMTRSGLLDGQEGERQAVMVSHIVDTTKKGFDTEDIKQKLKAELAAGRKVKVVSANSKTAAKMNVSGRITQRTAYVRGGKKRQEYYLQLVLTDAKSGMSLWDTVTPVVRKKQ